MSRVFSLVLVAEIQEIARLVLDLALLRGGVLLTGSVMHLVGWMPHFFVVFECHVFIKNIQ